MALIAGVNATSSGVSYFICFHLLCFWRYQPADGASRLNSFELARALAAPWPQGRNARLRLLQNLMLACAKARVEVSWERQAESGLLRAHLGWQHGGATTRSQRSAPCRSSGTPLCFELPQWTCKIAPRPATLASRLPSAANPGHRTCAIPPLHLVSAGDCGPAEQRIFVFC